MAGKPHPEAPIAILTRAALELVMFDLKKLPGVFNKDGLQGYLLLIVDHFTKFRWGCIVWGKDVPAIAGFLFDTFIAEGTPARWHADNGSEFTNGMVDRAREMLGLGNKDGGLLPYTHGGVRCVRHVLYAQPITTHLLSYRTCYHDNLTQQPCTAHVYITGIRNAKA
jgi:hypothetical protein